MKQNTEPSTTRQVSIVLFQWYYFSLLRILHDTWLCYHTHKVRLNDKITSLIGSFRTTLKRKLQQQPQCKILIQYSRHWQNHRPSLTAAALNYVTWYIPGPPFQRKAFTVSDLVSNNKTLPNVRRALMGVICII